MGVTVVVVLELAGWVEIGRRGRRSGEEELAVGVVIGARRRRELRLRERMVSGVVGWAAALPMACGRGIRVRKGESRRNWRWEFQRLLGVW